MLQQNMHAFTHATHEARVILLTNLFCDPKGKDALRVDPRTNAPPALSVRSPKTTYATAPDLHLDACVSSSTRRIC